MIGVNLFVLYNIKAKLLHYIITLKVFQKMKKKHETNSILSNC